MLIFFDNDIQFGISLEIKLPTDAIFFFIQYIYV